MYHVFSNEHFIINTFSPATALQSTSPSSPKVLGDHVPWPRLLHPVRLCVVGGGVCNHSKPRLLPTALGLQKGAKDPHPADLADAELQGVRLSNSFSSCHDMALGTYLI